MTHHSPHCGVDCQRDCQWDCRRGFQENSFRQNLIAIALVVVLLPLNGCSDTSASGLDGPATAPPVATESALPAAESALPPAVANGFAEAAQDSHEPESQATTLPQPNPVVQQATAIQENSDGEAEGGMLKKAGDLFDRAKSTTGSTANGAKNWVQDKIGGAADASSAATQDTVKWATDTFESLKSQGLTTANDASEWLSQDWKNMESWEYKIIALQASSNEEKSAELNQLGKNGWEVYHVSDGSSPQTFYLKKRRESYLRHLPFKDFIKLVPLIQQGTQ